MCSVIDISKLIEINMVFSAFQETFEKDYEYVGEFHDFWELVYCVEGCVGASEDEREYVLSKGDMVFHRPMEFHRIWSEKDTSPTVLIISFAVSSNKNIASLGELGVIQCPDGLEKCLYDAVAAACVCSEYEDFVQNQILANSLERFLLEIMKLRNTTVTQKKTEGSQNYQKALKFMEENYDKRLTSNEIAAECHMSLSNLKKTFKQYSGLGVMDYFNRLKMSEAVKMIEAGYNTTQISDALGFSSKSYFVVAFKRYFNMTPSKCKRTFNKRLMYDNNNQ